MLRKSTKRPTARQAPPVTPAQEAQPAQGVTFHVNWRVVDNQGNTLGIENLLPPGMAMNVFPCMLAGHEEGYSVSTMHIDSTVDGMEFPDTHSAMLAAWRENKSKEPFLAGIRLAIQAEPAHAPRWLSYQLDFVKVEEIQFDSVGQGKVTPEKHVVRLRLDGLHVPGMACLRDPGEEAKVLLVGEWAAAAGPRLQEIYLMLSMDLPEGWPVIDRTRH